MILYHLHLHHHNILPLYPLVWSSSLFLFPCAYALYKKKSKLFVSSSTLSTLISMHYWATCVHSQRYLWINMSLCKINGILYILHGYWNITNGVIRAISIINFISLTFLYEKSHEMFLQKSIYWIYYHMGFHLCSAAGGILSLI